MTPGPLRRILGLARRAADPTDDAGLLARFAATADADAFELLVWRHGGMVLGVCRRILGDAHAAEDAFQATFLALARQAKSVRRDGCVAGWLHRVARRVAVRARLRGRRTEENLRLPRNVNPDLRDDPITAATQRELRDVLDEELDRLPERFRRAVVLCYLEGRSTAEAAERLGCPRGTVLSRLATARAKLKTRLLRRGIAPAVGGLAGWTTSADAPAALVAPTVRAVIANSATPQVIDLCDGVLRAMILSKLKMTTAVVLTVGMLGGGAGWVALTPGGPGVALAGGQAKAPRSDSEQKANERKPDDDLRALHLVQEELGNATDNLHRDESRWAEGLIEARLKLADTEERYRQLERQSSDNNQGAVRVREAEAKVAAVRTEIGNLRDRGQIDEAHSAFKPLEEKLKAAEIRWQTEQDRNEHRQKDLAEAMRMARREMVTAEVQLENLERAIALRRRAVQGNVEGLQNRVIELQLKREGGHVERTERGTKDIERKLDDVLQELTKLRRELKK